jgi:hypothetical protein
MESVPVDAPPFGVPARPPRRLPSRAQKITPFMGVTQSCVTAGIVLLLVLVLFILSLSLSLSLSSGMGREKDKDNE